MRYLKPSKDRMAIITTITPMIQKILFMLQPSVSVIPRSAPSISNDGSAGRVPLVLPSRSGRDTPASTLALCSDRGTLRILALAYRQERLHGRTDSAARKAAIAAFLDRHSTATPAMAEEAVTLMLVVATAPDPQRATLRAVALAYREARHGGATAPAAYEAAVDAYLQRHPHTPPLEAYGAVARMLAVAVERSPQWFWRGMSAPRSNDL